MTRYLITGAAGMLGRDLQAALDGRSVTAAARADLDITNADAVGAAVSGHDVVINAAAWTRVDDAEVQESDAHAVNATGAGLLAAAAADTGARFVQVSTDYVFDGVAIDPYPEDAPLAPQSAYGRTKASGETAVARAHPSPFIVRTAWLYGEHGPNFPRTMLRLAAERDTVSVVTDQLGQPTWTRDVAAAIVALLDADADPGVYHATNAGETSWFGFAQEVFARHGLDPERVLPTDSASFVRPAPRPAYSVLGHDAWARIGIAAPRPWQDAIAEAASLGILR